MKFLHTPLIANTVNDCFQNNNFKNYGIFLICEYIKLSKVSKYLVKLGNLKKLS